MNKGTLCLYLFVLNSYNVPVFPRYVKKKNNYLTIFILY